MPDTIDISASPGTFPMPELVKAGIWAALKPTTHAVLGALWDFHRMYPDACRPSRETLAAYSGVSVPTVTRAITELEDAGLVVVIPPAGPGPNTYKMKWTGLTAPATPVKKTSPAGNTFRRPGSVSDTILVDGRGGRGNRVETVRRGHRHVMPDGCVLFSANEVAVHAWLQEWNIPHFSNVNYSALGIRGLHDQSVVDFVVAPKLLIEVWGMARNQQGAVTYNKKRALKEKAITKAGWTLIGIEPGKAADEAICTKMLGHWADSTIAAAEATYNTLKNRGVAQPSNYGHALWVASIQDAKDRKAGRKPAASPQGPWRIERVDDPKTGWPEDHRVWQPVRVVLEASAGKASPPSCGVGQKPMVSVGLPVTNVPAPTVPAPTVPAPTVPTVPACVPPIMPATEVEGTMPLGEPRATPKPWSPPDAEDMDAALERFLEG